MTPLDSWTLIAFFCGVFTIVTLLIDKFIGWIVRRANEVRVALALKGWIQ